MLKSILLLYKKLTLFQRFSLISFAIVLAGMIVVGLFVNEKIKNAVINETAADTAFYMESFVAPYLQELTTADQLTPAHIQDLDKLFKATKFGRHIVAFKVWDGNGRILFSDKPELIGLSFPSDEEQAIAFTGKITATISTLDEEEQQKERPNFDNLLQVYSPIRQDGTDRIIAVAEFYQTVNMLEADIAKSQQQSWVIVGLIMMILYFSYISFVQWADKKIRRQELALSRQVTQLTEVIKQNNILSKRVERAITNATELNEKFLRRISAELHDGPVQDLALALLRLDRFTSPAEAEESTHTRQAWLDQLPEIQESLERSMQEIRNISRGLGLPQLEDMTVPEILKRVTHTHTKRTGKNVSLEYTDLPEQVGLSFKITAYRFIQEALNNGARHGQGIGQKVQVHTTDDGLIEIAVSDQGPGFDPSQPIEWGDHLGLSGMRDRVESLGGIFQITSQVGHGTTVTARLVPNHREDKLI